MRLLRLITGGLERLLAAILFGMFLMIALLVVLRYAFGTTIIGGNEATIVAFVYTTAIGAAVSLGRDEHIAIRFFVEKLPDRMRTPLRRARIVLLVVLNVAVVVLGLEWIRQTGHFMLPTLAVPQWVAQICIPVGAALSAVYCLSRWRE